eukprot:TRINITY_DN79874_c0_g1_i1.p1 TRINITY_DN79874_c0_g1~~TRINITY_DN79874_c0_g1_i1.p1  ORF type:complete len:224 (+),score=40.24 TRINITY_DN79874_c0_g1_i1:91-762(+)
MRKVPRRSRAVNAPAAMLAPVGAAAVLLVATASTWAWAGPLTGKDDAVRRRQLLLGGTAALGALPGSVAASDSDFEPSGLLRLGSSLASFFLKPIYTLEAPLQAGDYDRAAVRARIDSEVKSSPVVVYSYSLSPFCSEAKSLLDSLGARYKTIELAPEWLPGLAPVEAAQVRAELGALTGQTSMPHVFIGGKSIGGLFTGTPGLVPLLESGELVAKLKAVGAL